MITPKPNLFHFATSELSQDAYLAWLMAWADPHHVQHDPALHRVAVQTLEGMLARCGLKSSDEIHSVMVQRQYKNIDVVVVVNGRVALAIEDKVHTQQHSNQLERYRQLLCNGFRPENVGGIYLKTGEQCDYLEVNEAGFVRFSRADLLAALTSGKANGVTNEIFCDFYEHLQRLENDFQSFRTMSPAEWGTRRQRWAGFFVELQTVLPDCKWKYAANQRGGFMGLWWHWRGNKYLQLEETKLCFKLEMPEREGRRLAWDDWHGRVMAASSRFGLCLKRPKYQSGTWMTVAVLSDDYRKVGADGLLDMGATTELLRRAEAVLNDAHRG